MQQSAPQPTIGRSIAMTLATHAETRVVVSRRHLSTWAERLTKEPRRSQAMSNADSAFVWAATHDVWDFVRGSLTELPPTKSDSPDPPLLRIAQIWEHAQREVNLRARNPENWSGKSPNTSERCLLQAWAEVVEEIESKLVPSERTAQQILREAT